MVLDDGYAHKLVSEQMGMCSSSLTAWIKRYEADGEAGLRDRSPNGAKRRLPEPIREKVIELKQENPRRGCKTISNLLKRLFCLGASHETVRKTLHEEELMEPPARKKPVRNPQKPRFFERTTPNQMWQTDIFCFRLAGRNAYLIGYIDDYSRFLVGLDLFGSQTATNVLELYRRAATEYGVPREMLTDNGRQYTNWRGKTKFEKEMVKDKISHIRSQPHHPMTLGKIERFWKTIYTEFLDRAQFGSYEEARVRLAHWVHYYNFQRPHQGIGGLCPADRYFEIANDLRKALEQQVAENALELALRGEPRAPFYMVGRMDKQSVVMEARKGKLVMRLNEDGNDKPQELTYDLPQGGMINEQQVDNRVQAQVAHATQRPDEGRGGPGDLDGAAQVGRTVSGAEYHVYPTVDVAGPGVGGYAQRTGTASGQISRSAVEPDQIAGEALRAQGPSPGEGAGRRPLGETPHQHTANAGQQGVTTTSYLAEGPVDERQETIEARSRVGQAPHAGDHASAGRHPDRDTGGGGAGCLPQNLLRVGEPGLEQHARGGDQPASRPAEEGYRSREATDGQAAGGAAEDPRRDAGDYGYTREDDPSWYDAWSPDDVDDIW
jgi:transposase InsO family protein